MKRIVSFIGIVLALGIFSILSYADTGAKKVRLSTNNGGVIQDSVYPSIVTTEIDHWIIHEGASYAVSGFVTVPSGKIVTFQFKNVTSGGSHFRGYEFVSTQGDATIKIYEGATVVVDGDALTLRNQNRNVANGAEVVAFINTSTTASGTLLEGDLIIGGKQSGGTGGHTIEWIFDEDAIYTIEYMNNDAGSDFVHYDFWLLETNLL